jgi:aminoglycoside phosphotransferase (APT) family kinase protein
MSAIGEHDGDIPPGMMGDPDVPGLDLARFRAFFEDVRPGAVNGPLRAQVIPGGKSNLTYEVTDGQASRIVRRPPLGHVLATAHDMSREHRVMTALHPTAVPVPATFALCEDSEVIGAPFYVMERVEGTPYRLASQLEPLGPGRTGAISAQMVDTLATLHRVDPADVGLSDFGRPHGFLTRQVHRLLAASPPVEGPPAVVHGDFRLDNLLVDDNDQVAAVIDWEMATLGDPLTDVALLLVYQRMADLDTGYAVADASTAPGFLTDLEMLNRYADRSGRELSAMGFYLGLAYFKLAVILEGVHYRFAHGQTVGAGFDTVGVIVEPLIAAGLTSMKEHN